MPRRKAERDQAKELFIKNRGKLKPKDIAEQLGVSAAQVRKWKCQDQWEKDLGRKRRGGQPGNKNAVGNSGGAPKGNTNAERHGAYSIPRLERWTPEEREALEQLVIEFGPLAETQLKRLLAKQHDLERRISELEADETDDTLYLDKKMTMTLPGGGAMEYINESTKFERRMLYEGELNKVQGRIQKLMDSIRLREEVQKRMDFEREKFTFAKQKALGEFTLDDSGEITEPESLEEIIE